MKPPLVEEPEPPAPAPAPPPLGEGVQGSFELPLSAFVPLPDREVKPTAVLAGEGDSLRWTFRADSPGVIQAQIWQLLPGCRITSIAIDHFAGGLLLKAQLTSFLAWGDVGSWSTSGAERTSGVMTATHDPIFDNDGSYLLLRIFGVDSSQSIYGVHVDEICY